MATPSFPSCSCTGDRDDASVSLHDILEAIVEGDIDRAIEAGLLRWNGCIACTIANGLSPTDALKLQATQASRLAALAARERYRLREHRLQERRTQRDARRTATGGVTPLQSALPTAAAAALARAKAKAAARAKP